MKVFIFDLDGVLVDSCNIHYESLNIAINEIVGEKFIISETEHIDIYNGLNTKTKLKLLTQKKGLDINLHDCIYNRKQEITKQLFNKIEPDINKKNILQTLKAQGYKLHCASNCIKETLFLILKNLGIFDIFDHIISNEDVINPKPSPEIYYKCFIKENVSPTDCIIFEDSIIGTESAIKSGANVCNIKNSNELTLEKIKQAVTYYENKIILQKTPFMKNINVVIPMSGNGSRFSVKGYIKPKPLIDVFDTPMITSVIKNIGFDANYIFIVKKEHIDTYNVDSILKSIVPDCKIIEISETTEGATCTVLLAKKFLIENNYPLLISNCDQYLDWDSNEFINNFLIKDNHLDAVISTFKSDGDKKWSYAKINSNNLVTEVREKNPISDIATTGLYLWRYSADFIKYAEQMISKNIRVNNEFYVAPVFNEAIEDGKKVGISYCNKFYSLGVPEDLEYFLCNYDKKL